MSDSHAIAVVQMTPNATPNTSLPASRTASDGTAWAALETVIRSPAASVTRRAPNRSAARPAGTETASVASPGSASSIAVSDGERS